MTEIKKNENVTGIKNNMTDLEMTFILSYLLNERKDHASIFISKAYTTIEKKNDDKKELIEFYESIRDDSTTNILVKTALKINDFSKEKALMFLQKIQSDKNKYAKEYKTKLTKDYREKGEFSDTVYKNLKYRFKKAFEIKVKDLHMDIIEKDKYDNKNATKKKSVSKI